MTRLVERDVTERSVQIAKAALAEAGRPDLADGVHNFFGWPGHRQVCVAHGADKTLIVRAFHLAHHAVGHHVTIGEDEVVGTYLTFPKDDSSCGQETG